MTDLVKDLQENARKYYGQIHISWFMFAKTLREIRTNNYFKQPSFKDYCEDEFPSMHFSTIVKTLKVVEKWGSELETRIKKSAKKLPAYESCYQLITAEDKIPKKDFVKLREDILEGRLGYNALRDKLKKIIDKKKDELREEIEDEMKSTEEIETELLDEIEDDLADVSDYDSKVETIIAQSGAKVEFLSEHLPMLLKCSSNGAEITDELVSFAEDLEELSSKINDFLTDLEDRS